MQRDRGGFERIAVPDDEVGIGAGHQRPPPRPQIASGLIRVDIGQAVGDRETGAFAQPHARIIGRVDRAACLSDRDAHVERFGQDRGIVLPRAELVETERQVRDRIEDHVDLGRGKNVGCAPCLGPADDDHPDPEIRCQRRRLPDIGFAVGLDRQRHLALQNATNQVLAGPGAGRAARRGATLAVLLFVGRRRRCEAALALVERLAQRRPLNAARTEPVPRAAADDGVDADIGFIENVDPVAQPSERLSSPLKGLLEPVSLVSGDPAISTRPIWVAPLTRPGVTGLPPRVDDRCAVGHASARRDRGDAPVVDDDRRVADRRIGVHRPGVGVDHRDRLRRSGGGEREREQADERSHWPIPPRPSSKSDIGSVRGFRPVPGDRAADEDKVRAAVDAERIARPEDDIGLETRGQRADAFLEPEQLRRVARRPFDHRLGGRVDADLAPAAAAFAAAILSRWPSFAESECIITQTPARSSSGALGADRVLRLDL
ncbi:hypothetical protein OUZ56_027550 [Daphnia magna]|uniref:Uncharacterized protein n=1 Tax=Daphnia magna TaxID=35525 RepID=A0ABQ9ZQ30_9CRUS|nr:hypothetical protein OUZ56_027550 [Daphnia magna]